MTPAPTEPRRGDFLPLAKVTKLSDAMTHPQFLQRLQMACGDTVKPQHMLSVLQQAVGKTPHLKEVPIMELLGAFVMLASIGLEPNTPLGHAHLIPFGRRKLIGGEWRTVGYSLEVVIGYPGLISLAYRSGAVTGFHADVVYKGDFFSYEYGSESHLRHRTEGDRNREPTHAYAYVKFKGGGEEFLVFPWSLVIQRRNESQAYQKALRAYNKDPKSPTWLKAPWVAHPHPMAAKMMVRAIRNYIPMSVELSRAIAIERASEMGVNFAQVFEIEGAVSADDLIIRGDDGDGVVLDGDDTMSEPQDAAQDAPATATVQKEAATTPAAETSTQPAAEDERQQQDNPFPDGIPLRDMADDVIGMFPTPLDWADEFCILAQEEGFERMRGMNESAFDFVMQDKEGADVLVTIHGVTAVAPLAGPAETPDEVLTAPQGDLFPHGLPKTRSGAVDGPAVLKVLADNLAEAPGTADAIYARWGDTLAEVSQKTRMQAIKLIGEAATK